LLAALVLLVGGVEQWNSLAVFVFLAHLPLAAVEGVIVGFTVCFLARVKPELLPGAEALWQVPTSVADRPLAPEAAEPAFESRHEQRSAPNRKAPSCNQSPQSSR